MVVNFPSVDCPMQLSENPVEGVCGQNQFAKQEIFLSAVFSNDFFFASSRHLKEFDRLPSNLDSS